MVRSSNNSTQPPKYGGAASPRRSEAGSESETALKGRSNPPPSSSRSLSTSNASKGAKPIGQFQFLEKSYKVNVPTCPLDQANELLKSICERYDIAVVNREKIDEALINFKTVLGMDRDAPLEDCFTAWKDCLVKPRFTITLKDGTGDVKDVRVTAENVPVERRKAQKSMRDLLDASHLFLQQREFLQRHIVNDMSQLEELAANLQTLASKAKLSSSEKKQVSRTVSTAQREFASFPDTLEMFWRQVYSLLQNINTAIHVLDGVSEPGSLARS